MGGIPFGASCRLACLCTLLPVNSILAAQPEGEPPAIPGYYQRLMEQANVRFEFYQPGQRPRHPKGHISLRPALTTFRLDVNHRFTFRYRTVDYDGGRRVTIQPRLEDLTFQLQNQVRLPKYLESDRRWSSRLVKHEFDHVAMTVDARVRMLFEHLHRRLGPIVRQVQRHVTIDQQWVQTVVNEEIAPRHQAVLDLLLANEELLDEVTGHGTARLKDRELFFRALFAEENLRQQGFPYLNEVRDLLRQPRYLEADLPYWFDKTP